MKGKNKFVPNDVYVFGCFLKSDFISMNRTVYTNPISDDKDLAECEELVKNQYFTKEKIEELKQELIEKIQKCNNPFKIECVDFDGDYNVTEEMLFKIK